MRVFRWGSPITQVADRRCEGRASGNRLPFRSGRSHDSRLRIRAISAPATRHGGRGRGACVCVVSDETTGKAGNSADARAFPKAGTPATTTAAAVSSPREWEEDSESPGVPGRSGRRTRETATTCPRIY